jgi:hypothetical protein
MKLSRFAVPTLACLVLGGLGTAPASAAGGGQSAERSARQYLQKSLRQLGPTGADAEEVLR